MPPRLDVTRIPPGTVLLGKYRVLQTIGVGGMGAVVACDHRTLGTRVALKFLLPRYMADRALARRFVREAQTANRIHSEHVARVMDVDQLPNGLPFIVMEFLEGNNLAALLKEGREFSLEEAVDFAVQCAEGLAQAHRVGVVHRDIKPSNLFLVERAGEPPLLKIVDFGISKVVGETEGGFQAALTDTSTVLGSGLYMSPEQMRSSKDVDHRTDIYGLGLCLYELLTRTLPYWADNFADLCIKVRTEPPVPLRRHRPDLPPELGEAIARAYAVSPSERYQTLGDFALALSPFAAPQTELLIEAVQRLGGARTGDRASAPPRAGAADASASATTGSGRHSPTAATRVEGTGPQRAIASTSSASSVSLRSTAASVGRKAVPWVVLGVCVVVGGTAAALLLGRTKGGAATHDEPTAPRTAAEPTGAPTGERPASPPAPPEAPTSDAGAAAPSAANGADTAHPAYPSGLLWPGPGAHPSASSASSSPSAAAAPSASASAPPVAATAATAAPTDTTAPNALPTAAPTVDPDVHCLTTDPVTGEQKQVPCQ